MRKKHTILFSFLLQLSLFSFAQKKNTEFLTATNQWFKAWELLSKEVYGINKFYAVDFVFFDSVSVFSTSAVAVPNGVAVEGNTIMKQSYRWKQAPHNGTLTLPDSSKIPVGLMSFAGDNKIGRKPFFVMPLPSFWKTAGVTSAELGLDKLITGVFLHEFSHSQQMQNFGKKIAAFEHSSNFGIDFTDDIVQDLFKQDSIYTAAFRSETNTFYKAAEEKDAAERKRIIQTGLMEMNNRQQTYFTGKYKELTVIDDFFLTMEGLGQYSMYAWLVHPKGGNLPKEQVIKGVRRGKKQWSQDEGFVLFLLLAKYASPKSWAPAMFANETTPVKQLLVNNIAVKN